MNCGQTKERNQILKGIQTCSDETNQHLKDLVCASQIANQAIKDAGKILQDVQNASVAANQMLQEIQEASTATTTSQKASYQELKEIQRNASVVATKISVMEFRQARAEPSTTDAYRFLDQFATGEQWTSSKGTLQEIARQLRFEEGQEHVGSYGAMKAQCDIRRGQFQTILDFFQIPWEEHRKNQDMTGKVALYHPAVRHALQRDQLTPTEASVLPCMPPGLTEALQHSQPLGTDWKPVATKDTRQMTQSLQAHALPRSTCPQSPGPHPSSIPRLSVPLLTPALDTSHPPTLTPSPSHTLPSSPSP